MKKIFYILVFCLLTLTSCIEEGSNFMNDRIEKIIEDNNIDTELIDYDLIKIPVYAPSHIGYEYITAMHIQKLLNYDAGYKIKGLYIFEVSNGAFEWKGAYKDCAAKAYGAGGIKAELAPAFYIKSAIEDGILNFETNTDFVWCREGLFDIVNLKVDKNVSKYNNLIRPYVQMLYDFENLEKIKVEYGLSRIR